MTCLIVEDEPLARNLLVSYVEKLPSLQLVEACANPLAALEILRNQPIDLLFLDIQMPEITGLNLLKILHHKPLVILTTAYSEYALEGYELDVVDYLMKPISLERFLRAVEKASKRRAPQAPAPAPEPPAPAPVVAPRPENVAPPEKAASPFVFIKDGTKLVKVRWDDILYIEGLKDYVAIHTRQQKIVSLQRLKTLENLLPADNFIRVHHSYIVALEGIDAVHKNEVQIGQSLIPISDTYKKAFREFIDRNHIQPE
ncbi:DNA-binding response regulator, LytR/AlgR family [Catalinimonas alkaloidigena]|uniref:DNA-binding response regulator, LytR/AlgR family n=1 Tax=Catalinimonas alkaloidigena TaxID=1075417 RepID=A0A1G9BUP3_9BACT|nr:response regulator transcription factor [Catalinimonas alkaloidigena]SDK42715.1 DNA-binding response regulator, LytR/AlgR family [Catalinimonas alkaloidigena]